jgi:hypothetical protein
MYFIAEGQLQVRVYNQDPVGHYTQSPRNMHTKATSPSPVSNHSIFSGLVERFAKAWTSAAPAFLHPKKRALLRKSRSAAAKAVEIIHGILEGEYK